MNYKQNNPNPNPITGTIPPPPFPSKVDVIQRSSGMSKRVNSLSQEMGGGGVSNIPSQLLSILSLSSFFFRLLRQT